MQNLSYISFWLTFNVAPGFVGYFQHMSVLLYSHNIYLKWMVSSIFYSRGHRLRNLPSLGFYNQSDQPGLDSEIFFIHPVLDGFYLPLQIYSSPLVPLFCCCCFWFVCLARTLTDKYRFLKIWAAICMDLTFLTVLCILCL